MNNLDICKKLIDLFLVEYIRFLITKILSLYTYI